MEYGIWDGDMGIWAYGCMGIWAYGLGYGIGMGLWAWGGDGVGLGLGYGRMGFGILPNPLVWAASIVVILFIDVNNIRTILHNYLIFVYIFFDYNQDILFDDMVRFMLTG